MVELFYQIISPNFVDELIGRDAPLIARFAGYYADADKTPVVIQSTTLTVTPTENESH